MKITPLILLSSFSMFAAPCLTEQEAKGVAECETLGEAVSARLLPHNASFGKWEVLVHMPAETEGWRVFIHRDSGKLIERHRIPNPPSKVR